MKKKSTSRSIPARRGPAIAGRRPVGEGGFFNLRVLIGLCIVFVGACLALAGLGAFSALAQGGAKSPGKNLIITTSNDPLVPVPFDCSRIHELGIDRQENFRAQAIMIACGNASGGSAASSSGSLTQILKKIFAPLNYGGTDVNLITGPDVSPNVVQSETYSLANPENANQILIRGAATPAQSTLAGHPGPPTAATPSSGLRLPAVAAHSMVVWVIQLFYTMRQLTPGLL